MKNIHRKLIRDLIGSKGLFVAVVVVVLLAVTFYGAMDFAYQNLSESYDYSYEKLRFADFTVKVQNDAETVLEDLKGIDGIDAVTGRMNADYALKLPGAENKKALARTLSMPDSQSARAGMVNDVLVKEGEYFEGNNPNKVLIEKNFADHHDLQPGQTVHLVVQDEPMSFEIAGIAASPEYIFLAKSRQEILVSPEIWGVIFVPESARTDLLNEPVKEFCFLVDQTADREAVISKVEMILEPYNVLDIVPQEEQPSNAGLEMDLEQFQTLALLFPLLFIIVGAMAIYILLTRIVHNQRTQIGLMRALGYSRGQVMNHYAWFSLVVGIVGALLGTVAGYFSSEAITNLYASMINLPYTVTHVQWTGMIQGFFIGLLPCVVAGLIPAWQASHIAPAEAMRTPAPTAGRKLLLERLFPSLARASSLWKIPMRNVFRNRRRSFYTVVGITFGVSLILVSAAMIDSIVDLMDFMFDDIQRYDAKVQFAEPQSESIAQEVANWAEVERAEPMLEWPVRLQHGDDSYTTLLIALSKNSELRGVYSPSRNKVVPVDEGVLLSEPLKQELDVKTGEMISLGDTKELEVKGFVEEPMGSFAYLSLEQAHSLMGNTDTISSLLLRIKPGKENIVRERALGLQGAASVELTSETRARIDEMMESGSVMLYIMLLFGATLAFAIVFTTVTVNIMERRREIATMRTIGEGKRRISAMITIENLSLGISGLLPGIILGYILALYFFSMFQGDMFSMDLVVFPRTYIMTAVAVIVIMLISQMPSIRNINRMDLSQVVKEQAS